MAELLAHDLNVAVERLWLRLHAVRRMHLISPHSTTSSHAQPACMQVPLPLLQVEDVAAAVCGQPCHFTGVCLAVSSVGCRIASRLLTCPACDAKKTVLPGTTIVISLHYL